jgi:uncharacterized membrane protein YfcA
MFGLDSQTLLGIALALVLGGLVKGTIGIGLPIASVAVLSQFLEVRLILALMSLPIVLTNVWQVVQAGRPQEAARRFWPVIVVLMMVIFVSGLIVVRLDQKLIYSLIGLAILGFAVMNLTRPAGRLTPAAERWAGPLAGALAGVLGGISTIWSPPILMFFIMLRLPKEAFGRALGLVLLSGCFPLILAYVQNGILTPRTAALSAAATVPALGGQLLGQWLRKRIDEQRFRKIVLIALLVSGLNLLRRALF